MRQRHATQAILGILLLLMLGLPSAAVMQPDSQALIQLTWQSRIEQARLESLGIPVYARLASADGSSLLAGANAERIGVLENQGFHVQILDVDTRGASYYLAHTMPGHSIPDWSSYGDLVFEDGLQALLRTTPLDADRLAMTGLEVAALSLEPTTLHPISAAAIPDAIVYDPFIASIIAQVDQAALSQYEEWLSGKEPATVGGTPYTIETRYSRSTTPINKATQFAYEHFQALGLDVEYQEFSLPGTGTRRNVLATQPGKTEPDKIYIICAHLDSTSNDPYNDAPGADDNGSGSAGVLVAADILSHYDSTYTLIYALWTGEEQGLHGSNAWAEWASAQGLDILGVLNMDMIAYDSDASPIVDLHVRSWLPDSVSMANLFQDVVDVYSLDLEPDILVDNWLGNYSDNKPFWDEGYAAILAIEDYDDFTPHYHTVNDKLSTLNMPYFAEFAKASIGTLAHMSSPFAQGVLTGRVTDADTGLPIAAASMGMSNASHEIFTTVTNDAGNYTYTLPVETYTVTASAHGYQATTITDVLVITHTVVHRDLTLQPVPIIEIEPDTLEATLYADEAVTLTLWISNTGKANLDFVLHELDSPLTLEDESVAQAQAGVLPWFFTTPSSGTVSPGETVTVSVVFSNTGLDVGAYNGYLDAESNDPAMPNVTIPTTLTVQPACVPVEILTVTAKATGCTVAFGAELTGTAPYVYNWDFQGLGSSAVPTPTVSFGISGTHPYTLAIQNCGGRYSDVSTGMVTTMCRAVYLPLVTRGAGD